MILCVKIKPITPGQRAVLPKAYVAASLNAVYQLIYQVYQVPEKLRLKPQMLFYALITQPENSSASAAMYATF